MIDIIINAWCLLMDEEVKSLSQKRLVEYPKNSRE